MNDHTRRRCDQRLDETWDLTPMFKNLSAWKDELAKESRENYDTVFARFRVAKALTPTTLCELLTLYYRLERRLKRLYTWAHLYHDQDIANDAAKQAFQRITTRYHDFAEATSWIEPKILAHSKSQIQLFLKSRKLAPFRIHVERIVRNKPHTLAVNQEKLLTMSQRALEAPHRAFSAINDADLVFPAARDSKKKEHTVTHGSYGSLMRNPDRTLREQAFLSIHNTYNRYQNTIAELLQGQVQRHVFEARARGFSSALEAALWPKNIPPSVYTTLIATVREGCKELHRYVNLKKRALHLRSIAPWDLYAPIPGTRATSYTFDIATDLVIKSCATLGHPYVKRLLKGLTSERWVDQYENLHKRSGAYSSGCYDSHPYILMNFTGTLRDVFTLAHEAGHSMHSELSKNQPYHYSEYAIFVAEVASTFNEALLAKHLIELSQDDPSQKALLLHEQLEDLRATLFRQTMFAEFELFLHEQVERGQPLTPSILNQKFYELNAWYYGPSLSIPDALATEWARIPHFYYNFYVYQYATGVSAAHSLAERMPSGVDKYLQFLSSGSSDYPLELLQQAGIDMRKPDAVRETVKIFGHMVDELSDLIPSLST